MHPFNKKRYFKIYQKLKKLSDKKILKPMQFYVSQVTLNKLCK